MAKAKKRSRKHTPQRTCVGCQTVDPKRSLIRIVRTSDSVLVDPHGKLNGRGAYLHEKRSCWEKGLQGRLAHALKTELSEDDIAQLTVYKENLPPNKEYETAENV